MNPEETTPQTPTQEAPHPVVHTYQEDLALAMDTTDAKVVQELLQTARERETIAKEEVVESRQKGWYTTGATILILLAVGAIGYGVYYFTHLTVPVQKNYSVGVFANTTPIIAPDTTIATALATLTSLDTLPENKPTLVPIVVDRETLAPLEKTDFFAFINARASEPFQTAMSLVRLGVMNTGRTITPFLIFSVQQPDIATKEFLIAEPKLLELFAPALGITLSTHTEEIGKSFESSYMYNLPVRTLRYTDPTTNEERILLFYGYATDTVIVLGTDPTVLKAVYDTIIRQH